MMSNCKKLHPNRLKGTLSLIKEGADTPLSEYTTPVTHHRVYYEKIFEAMRISAAKNLDYAGGENEDPLHNFKKVKSAGFDPKMGLMMRMYDKIGRIETFFKTGKLNVKDESVEDAFMDLGNYCFLMLALMDDERSEDTNNI